MSDRDQNQQDADSGHPPSGQWQHQHYTPQQQQTQYSMVPPQYQPQYQQQLYVGQSFTGVSSQFSGYPQPEHLPIIQYQCLEEPYAYPSTTNQCQNAEMQPVQYNSTTPNQTQFSPANIQPQYPFQPETGQPPMGFVEHPMHPQQVYPQSDNLQRSTSCASLNSGTGELLDDFRQLAFDPNTPHLDRRLFEQGSTDNFLEAGTQDLNSVDMDGSLGDELLETLTQSRVDRREANTHEIPASPVLSTVWDGDHCPDGYVGDIDPMLCGGSTNDGPLYGSEKRSRSVSSSRSRSVSSSNSAFETCSEDSRPTSQCSHQSDVSGAKNARCGRKVLYEVTEEEMYQVYVTSKSPRRCDPEYLMERVRNNKACKEGRKKEKEEKEKLEKKEDVLHRLATRAQADPTGCICLADEFPELLEIEVPKHAANKQTKGKRKMSSQSEDSQDDDDYECAAGPSHAP